MTPGILVALLITLAFPSPAVHGVKIVTRQVTGGLPDIRTEYITENRLRTEWLALPDKPESGMASIIQGGERQRVFVLDLQAHEYVSWETDSHGSALSAHARPVAESGGTLQIWIDSVDTGERREIFGRPARHIITKERRIASPGACSANSESQTDGWYVDMTVLPEWRQPKKKGDGVVVSSILSAGNCLNKVDKIEVHHAGIDPGFPVKVTTTLQSDVKERDRARTVTSTWGSEVVELHAGPLDPALFEVPPDFHQVEHLRNFSATPPRRQLSGWDWFKEKVEEMFR
ncbi:MAG TPA: hypothetical protein VFK06_01000 [Candidatus Angelobacter sp.]|nr:hypothetical protein [Candidatus Angelobacter sp.]